MGLFFTNLFLSWQMKQNIIIVLTKKNTFVIFGFFAWKTHPGRHYKHQVRFCMQHFFFVKFLYEHKSKFAARKRIINFIPQICVFIYEKKAYHTIFIYENYMLSIFSDQKQNYIFDYQNTFFLRYN